MQESYMPVRKLNRYRYWWIFALSIVAFFLLLQFVLPIVVRHYANAKINSYPGLGGEIGSVKLHFITGEYLVQKVKLRYTDKGEREILHFEELGIRLYWRSLLKGALEGDGWLQRPHLSIWAPKSEKEAARKVDERAKKIKKADWQAQIRDLVPFKINKFEVHDGTIRYRDPHTKPPIDLKIQNIALQATNFTNREKLKTAMFAKVTAQAKMFGSGHGELTIQLDPIAKHPTFELKSAIKSIDLTQLNDFLMAYGKFDVDRGQFSLFNEIVAKNGKFVAYAKPMFHNIDVRAWEAKEHRNNTLLMLWKNIVGFVVDILKNRKKDQLAIKIKAEGTFEDPDVNVWEAIGSLLRNGFIQALIPGYDKSIKWTDVPDKKLSEH